MAPAMTSSRSAKSIRPPRRLVASYSAKTLAIVSGLVAVSRPAARARWT